MSSIGQNQCNVFICRTSRQEAYWKHLIPQSWNTAEWMTQGKCVPLLSCRLCSCSSQVLAVACGDCNGLNDWWPRVQLLVIACLRMFAHHDPFASLLHADVFGWYARRIHHWSNRFTAQHDHRATPSPAITCPAADVLRSEVMIWMSANHIAWKSIYKS